MGKTVRIAAAVLVLALVLPMMPVPAAAREPVFGTLWQHFSGLEEQWLRDVTVYDQVPVYYQTDYPDTPYGHGTVATSGCGITCLAMAASYLQSKRVTPDQLAAQFGNLTMNNVQRMNYAIEELDLPLYSSPRRWSQMMTALRNGQIVILLVNDQSDFTDGQHMLVLTGLTEDGRVLVHDPYEPNHNDPDLITGYAIGFRESTLSKGFDGGWIFGQKDPAAAPDYATPYRNFRYLDWVDE